jgi:hypothetical protein
MQNVKRLLLPIIVVCSEHPTLTKAEGANWLFLTAPSALLMAFAWGHSFAIFGQSFAPALLNWLEALFPPPTPPGFRGAAAHLSAPELPQAVAGSGPAMIALSGMRIQTLIFISPQLGACPFVLDDWQASSMPSPR